MKKVIIVPDQMDKSTWSEEYVEDVCAYLYQQFDKKLPEGTIIYHNHFAESQKLQFRQHCIIEDIARLQSLEGTFYVVIKPQGLDWRVIGFVFGWVEGYMWKMMNQPLPDQFISSNNQLTNRQNTSRINGRVPDIYGQVRSTPDLISTPFRYYDAVTGLATEYSMMAIGRGHFLIEDAKEGDTDVGNITGAALSVYPPGADLTGTPQYQIGESFTEYPLYIRKSSAINGQELEKPNDDAIETDKLFFIYPNIIRARDSSVDFTQWFQANDNLSLFNAKVGTIDMSINGNFIANGNFTIRIESETYIDDVGGYQGLTLSGFIVEVTRTVIIDDMPTLQTTEYDLSGNYKVSSVTYEVSGSNYIYIVTLSSPKLVNYNWNYIDQNSNTVAAAATFTDNQHEIDLDGTYTVSSVVGYSPAEGSVPASYSSIALTLPSAINPAWNELQTLVDQSTEPQIVSVRLNVVSSKWVGWYDIKFAQAEGMILNLYYPLGLYWSSQKSGMQYEASSRITVEYQKLDAITGNPVGEVFKNTTVIEGRFLTDFGRTIRIDFSSSFTGAFRFRLCSDQPVGDMYYRSTAKIEDVYGIATTDKTTYPDVTIVRYKAIATKAATSVKEKKTNLLVTRKLPVDGTGELVPTKQIDQIIINMAIDDRIGRRTINEVDIPQIKAETQIIRDYFGSEVATEFGYQFNDAKSSFEEQVQRVAAAGFSEIFRMGNKLRLKFEQPQENAVLLLNHRNKIPGTEKRSLTIGNEKGYDGVIVEYTDPEDDTVATYSIPEDGTAKNPLKITAYGVRSLAQAQTRAWREWNKLQYQILGVEVEATDETELLLRNDCLMIADNTNIATQDGDVLAINGLTITTSQDVIFEEGHQYYVYLQMSNGTIDMIEVVPGEFTDHIILQRPPLEPLVVEEDRYIKTKYIVVSDMNVGADIFMLNERDPASRRTNKLTCSNYDDRYYEMDHSFF